MLRKVLNREVRWWASVCVSTRGRNQFPSVLLQPLGHLSALESTSCKRSWEDYRTRRRLTCAFLASVWIQQVRRPRDSPNVESVSDLLMSRDYLQRFASAGFLG